MDTEILRPNAPGDYTALSRNTGNANWEMVDEEVADEHTTRVYTNSLAQVKDAYGLGDTSIPDGSTINSVKIYFRFRGVSTEATMHCQPFLRLGTNETSGTEKSDSAATWTTHSEVLDRPGGGDWAVADLNDLQAVIGLRTENASYMVQGTQVYVEVDYTPPVVGWTGKISGVTNPAKIMGVDVANIKSVKGVE